MVNKVTGEPHKTARERPPAAIFELRTGGTKNKP